MNRFETMPAEHVLAKLGTSPQRGLTEQQVAAARKLQKRTSKNEPKEKSLLKLFLLRLTAGETILAVLLIICMFFLIGLRQGLIALFVYAGYACFSVLFELQAEGILRYHTNRVKPKASVVRDGQILALPFEELVLGDLLFLTKGSVAPCDIRLIESRELVVDQSSLSGPGSILPKDAAELCDGAIFNSGKKNMMFMDSIVVSGEAAGVAVALGEETELVKRLEVVQQPEEKLAVLRQYDPIRQYSYFATVFFTLLTFVLCILRQRPLEEMILAPLFVAFLTFPKSLRAAVTILIARGIRRLAKKGIYIASLASVYKLAETKVFLCEKSQVFTKEYPLIDRVYFKERVANMKTVAYQPFQLLLQGITLCYPKVSGLDSIVDYFTSRDLSLRRVTQNFTLVADKTEESGLYSALFSAGNNRTVTYYLGNFAELLPRCNSIIAADGIHPIGKNNYKKMKAAALEMTKSKERLLCLCMRGDDKTIEGDGYIFVGLLSLRERLRSDAKKLSTAVYDYGMQLVLFADGDNADVKEFAQTIGMQRKNLSILDTRQFDRILDENIRKHTIFTNLTTEQKRRVAKVFAGKQNAVLTMSDLGGGVNISTGESPDSEKIHSDIHLRDSSLLGIVSAVVSCQCICGNIKKYIKHLLILSYSLACVLMAGLFIYGYPLFTISYAFCMLMLGGYVLALLFGEELPRRESFSRTRVDSIFQKWDVLDLFLFTLLNTVILLMGHSADVLRSWTTWRELLIFACCSFTLSQTLRTQGRSFFANPFFHNMQLFFTGISIFGLAAFAFAIIPNIAMPIPMILQCMLVGLLPFALGEGLALLRIVVRKAR